MLTMMIVRNSIVILTIITGAAASYKANLNYGFFKLNEINMKSLDVPTNNSTNDTVLIRWKRSSLADECSALRISSITAGGTANIAAAAAGAASSLGIFGAGPSIAAGVVSTAGFVVQTGADLAWELKGCSDIPFNDLKDVLSSRFKKTDEALDRNYQTLNLVKNMIGNTLSIVEKTRFEMRLGFDKVIDIIQNSNIQKIVNGVNKFSNFFVTEKFRIENLPNDKRVVKLEEQNGFLQQLKDSRTAKTDSLHSLLYEIINGHFVVAKNGSNDQRAVSALYTLYYGAQTYASVMFFLINQYSFLCDYYYQNGDLKKYNNYFDNTQTTFDDFKSSLVGNGQNGGVLSDVLKVFVDENKEWKKNKQENEKIDLMKKIKEDIKNMKLQLITDLPEKLTSKPSFKNSNISTPIGNWVDGSKVIYAVQYNDKETYSKVSDWSNPITIRGKANPTLKVPVDRNRRTRLIFRTLNNGESQLVGSMKTSTQTTFTDIDRDLYNAAARDAEDIAINVIEILINNGAKIETTFDNGRSAIHAAALGGNINIAKKYLLNKISSIDVTDINGFTPLHVAAKAGNDEFVEFLLENKANVNAKTKVQQYTPLHIATNNGYASTAESLLKNDAADVNAPDIEGFSCFHKAIYGGVEVFEIIMSDKRTDVNLRSKEGLTALHLSTIDNYDDIVQALLKNDKVDVNAKADGGMTTLHVAAVRGNVNIVKLLLESSKTDVNAKALNDMTPLHYAISLKNTDVVSVLINAKNIDINIFSTGEIHVTPLLIAAASGLTNIVKDLINKKADINAATQHGSTSLHLASRNNHLDVVKSLAENGANLEAKDKDSNTPFLLALKSANIEIAKYLGDKGAQVKDVRDNLSNTALMIAVKNNSLEMVKYLIEKGNDVNAKNSDNETPLMIAINNNSTDIAIYLIENNANVEETDKKGNLLTFLAVNQDNLPLLKYLKQKGAKMYTNKENKNDLILIAIKHSYLAMVKYLVIQRADIFSDKRPLNEAENIGNKDVIAYIKKIRDLFTKCLAKPNEVNQYMLDASKAGDLDSAEFLVEDITLKKPVKNNEGKTPTHLASEGGYLELVKYLQDKNVDDVNDKDKENRTPLFLAAMNGHLNVVMYLVNDRSADKTVKDTFYKKTAAEIARDRQYYDIAKFLDNK